MPSSSFVSSVFVPPSIGHAKRKAKQLRRAFPHLSLPLAQRVTAEALGFPDWYRLDRAIKLRVPPSETDACVDAAEVQSRIRTQIFALTSRGELTEALATDFQAIWGLTSVGKPQATIDGSWPGLLDDPEVDEFLKRFEARMRHGELESPLQPNRYRQPCLIVVDRSEPLPTLTLRRPPPAKGKSGRRAFAVTYPSHPLEWTDIPPDLLESAIARWQSTDAEFFVVLSGGGGIPDEMLAVRRINNLLSEVLPRMAEIAGELFADVKAPKGLERLCRTATSRVSIGRLRDAFRPMDAGKAKVLDPLRVQIGSREHLGYEESLMTYLFERWWTAAERRAEDGIETCEHAVTALQRRSRATMSTEGVIVMEYLLPNGDSAGIVLDKDCYTILPKGYQDTARRFALASAAEETLWHLHFRRRAI